MSRLLVELMHLVADAADRRAAIALAVGRVQRRQHLRQRRVGIPQRLEHHQLGDQRVQLAFVLGRRHQEQDAVQVALLRHDALLAQEVRDHGGRHAEISVGAGLAVDAGRQQHQLVRVDHRVTRGHAGITVPGGAGLEVPALLLALDQLGGQAFPGHVDRVGTKGRAAHADAVGHEGVEEPLFLRRAAAAREVLAELAQLLARLDAELDAAVPQHLAGLAFVDLGVDVQRCEQRIERRGRDVLQEGFVEALVVDESLLAAQMLVALVDLAGLREAGALLVHRLRREQPAGFRRQILQPHRAVAVEQRVEGVVADPGFVPQHVVAQPADLLQHLAHVVDRAVVGAQLDAGHAEGPRCIGERLVLDLRVLADLLAQRGLVPGLPVDRADHAEGVARGRQEDRNGAGLHQRALVQRLVVVAVEQHQVAALEQRAGDDLVRGAGAVEHEVGAVGAEDLGRVRLRLLGRALVDQQVAEFDIGVAQVVAEDGLAEVLEEQLPRRRLAIELPALVAGAVEGDGRLAVVGHQLAEEGRQQAHAVLDEAGDDLLGVEDRRLLAQVDVALDLAQPADHRQFADAVRIGQGPQRRAKAQAAHAAHQRLRALEAGAVGEQDVGADRRVLGQVARVHRGQLDLVAFGADLRQQFLGRRAVGVDDGDDLQQLVERDRHRLRLQRIARIAVHGDHPFFTQSTSQVL